MSVPLFVLAMTLSAPPAIEIAGLRGAADRYAIAADPKPKAERKSLRVLSYNIHHGEGTDGKIDLPRIATIIASVKPDLVALQEVDKKTKRSGGVDQTAELAKRTGLKGTFFRAIAFEGGEYGQAILARVAFDEGGTHQLPGPANQERRIAGYVRGTVDGRELAFVTAHFNHLSDANRREQAAKLDVLFADAKGPVIVAGDLNATPDSEPLKRLAKNWTPAKLAVELFTIPSAKPTRQIDYILHRSSHPFRVAEVKVLDEPVASDHRPIFAVLEWPEDSK